MKWILAFLLSITPISSLLLIGLIADAYTAKVTTENQQLLEVASPEIIISAPSFRKVAQHQVPKIEVTNENTQYDWRLDIWAQEQLNAFSRSYETVDLTDQHKADAFDYCVINSYQYVVCNL